MPEIVTVVLAAILVGWGIVSYNLLVRDRNRVAQSWSDVDVQLTRRHDLVPRLVELVQQYAKYERALLENVSTLRTRGAAEVSPGARGPLEGSLGTGMHRLIAVAEAYPELKASGNFLDLQGKLADTENQIQYARRYYNGAVNNLNTRIESFPDLIVARMFAFRPAEYFCCSRCWRTGSTRACSRHPRSQGAMRWTASRDSSSISTSPKGTSSSCRERLHSPRACSRVICRRPWRSVSSNTGRSGSPRFSRPAIRTRHRSGITAIAGPRAT